MVLSFGLIFLTGLALSALFQKMKLPGLVGMLLGGMVLGPFCLNLLDPEMLEISSALRQIALIIILIKAGLSLDLNDLKKVGRPALMLTCVPATFELAAYVLFAPSLLHVSLVEAALMGSVLAAVSPAVVVPRMVRLMEEGYGVREAIPQMILTGASCDDIYVIVLFSTFCQMAQGGAVNASAFLDIPVSILCGIAAGCLVGWVLSKTLLHKKDKSERLGLPVEVLLILAVSFVLMGMEDLLKGILAFSGLLAVVAASCVIRKESRAKRVEALSGSFGNLWKGAEVLLFVLVGAAVDFRAAASNALPAIIMIFAGLLFRSAGVLVCLLGTTLSKKERLFCVFAYLPKATVQAAIGSVPLSLGLSCGNVVLSVAVMGILITAPLGALLIDRMAKKLLSKDPEIPAGCGKVVKV